MDYLAGNVQLVIAILKIFFGRSTKKFDVRRKLIFEKWEVTITSIKKGV